MSRHPNQPKLTFALHNSQLTHISTAPSGLACDCLCPGCHTPLIAKKGKQTTHHFSYQSTDCHHGPESALHLATKDVLAGLKRLYLPPVNGEIPGFGWQKLQPGRIVRFDQVIVEPWLGSFRPDIIGSKNGRRLLIEIKVTHAVDAAKLEKIRALGISAVEVVMPLPKEEADLGRSEGVLLGERGSREWLYNAALPGLIMERHVELVKEQMAREFSLFDSQEVTPA